MRLEVDADAFLAGLSRLVRRTDDATPAAVTSAGDAVGREFRARARRLSGAHAASYRVDPPRRVGEQWVSSCGPTTVYSRKISLRYRDFEGALRAAASRDVGRGFAQAWRRGLG